MRAEVSVLASLLGLLSLAGCYPGPAARCEAGREQPRCPVSSESWVRTRYEPVCGEAWVDCTAGIRVVSTGGRPQCDPTAPELEASCPNGDLAYCYFADCREDSE